ELEARRLLRLGLLQELRDDPAALEERRLRLRVAYLLRHPLDVIDGGEHALDAAAGVEVVLAQVGVLGEQAAQGQVAADREGEDDPEGGEQRVGGRVGDQERDHERRHADELGEVVEDRAHLYAVALLRAWTRSLEAMNEPPVWVAMFLSVPVSASSP